MSSTTSIDAKDIVYVSGVGDLMSILNMDGKRLARWGGEKIYILDFVSKHTRDEGEYIWYRNIWERLIVPGKFCTPHCAFVDSKGDIYVGETYGGQRIQKFPNRIE
jgi:hypothetical protein